MEIEIDFIRYKSNKKIKKYEGLFVVVERSSRIIFLEFGFEDSHFLRKFLIDLKEIIPFEKIQIYCDAAKYFVELLSFFKPNQIFVVNKSKEKHKIGYTSIVESMNTKIRSKIWYFKRRLCGRFKNIEFFNAVLSNFMVNHNLTILNKR